MWVARWSFDENRDRFGTEHSTERGTAASLLVAVLPIADPLMDPVERSKLDLFAPEDKMIAAALSRFERNATLGPPLVVEALCEGDLWPPRGDWIVVTCRDDGSARYGIAPFVGVADVGNPREACGAIRRVLGE